MGTILEKIHCLQIKTMYKIMSLFLVNHQEEELLSEDCTEKLVIAVSMVERRCQMLDSGNITVADLHELQKNEEKLVTLVNLIQSGGFTGDLVSKLVKLRCKEVADIKQKALLVTTLTSICHSLCGGMYE